MVNANDLTFWKMWNLNLQIFWIPVTSEIFVESCFVMKCETLRHVADSQYTPVCSEFWIADFKYFFTDTAAEQN